VIRTFVAAASPVVRAGLEALLTRSASVTVVGTSSGHSLADDIESHEPQVLLVAVDASERPASVLTSLSSLSPDAESRSPAIVLMVPNPTTAWTADALRAGVRGVLARDASSQEIIAALEAAVVGLATLPAELAVELASGTRTSIATRERTPTQPLTRREIEVLGMLAEGLANKNIAARLHISEHTVKTHVASILTKFDAFSRAEAVAIGARRGLILL
jgi:DNA-binding NarL/FixJ family response regulator